MTLAEDIEAWKKENIPVSHKKPSKKPIAHEAQIQRACFQWLDYYPEIRDEIIHIPNGGKRNAFEAYNLKREGVRAGVFDIYVLIPSKGFHGLWIEMKHGKNKLSDAQEAFQARVLKRGYQAIVCYSLDEFIKAIEDYLGK